MHDGKVVREGTASGEIQGQKWQATLTAERDTDHTGLTQAVAAARQAYDQGAGEYTAASLENLADAIEQADELDRTGATDEAMDAMRDRLAEAVGNLDTITWKTDGTTLSHEKGQGYDGKAPGHGRRRARRHRGAGLERPDLGQTRIHHHRPRPE